MRLSTFRDYFKHLDRHRPQRMKPQHAQRVVYLHSQNEISTWKYSMTALFQAEQAATAFADSLACYTNVSVDNMAVQKKLAAAFDEAVRTRRLIEADTKIHRSMRDFSID